MKSKIFKSVLPALAILLAISLSFATTANKTMNQVGYYDDPLIPGIQEVPGSTDCQMTGDTPCTYDGFEVYAEQALINQLWEKQ